MKNIWQISRKVIGGHEIKKLLTFLKKTKKNEQKFLKKNEIKIT